MPSRQKSCPHGTWILVGRGEQGGRQVITMNKNFLNGQEVLGMLGVKGRVGMSQRTNRTFRLHRVMFQQEPEGKEAANPQGEFTGQRKLASAKTLGQRCAWCLSESAAL